MTALLAVKLAFFELVQILMELASAVVETTALKGFLTYDAFDNSLPLVLFSTLAGSMLSHELDSSKEVASSFISPHVNVVANFASWNFSGSQTCWETLLHHFVERTANLFFASRRCWANWDFFSPFDPLTVLESPPVAVFVFPDVAFMMPVAIIPGPAVSSEAIFAWTPVVPSAIVPSVPGFLLRVPFPNDFWFLVLGSAPLANLWVSLVLLDEVQTFFLCVEDSFVLGVNLGFSLAIVLG